MVIKKVCHRCCWQRSDITEPRLFLSKVQYSKSCHAFLCKVTQEKGCESFGFYRYLNHIKMQILLYRCWVLFICKGLWEMLMCWHTYLLFQFFPSLQPSCLRTLHLKKKHRAEFTQSSQNALQLRLSPLRKKKKKLYCHTNNCSWCRPSCQLCFWNCEIGTT